MSITLHINQGIKEFFADCTCVCNAFLNALLDFNSFESFGKPFYIIAPLYAEGKIFHNLSF